LEILLFIAQHGFKADLETYFPHWYYYWLVNGSVMQLQFRVYVVSPYVHSGHDEYDSKSANKKTSCYSTFINLPLPPTTLISIEVTNIRELGMFILLGYCTV
jgi:hypothetical protein